jgi:hypothetical protein
MGSRIDGHGGEYSESRLGMTLRDYFAGQALAGMNNSIRDTEIEISTKSYAIADAMIAERSKS